MAIGKLSVTFPHVSFRGEGDQDWLSEQLEKVLAAASSIESWEPLDESAIADPSSSAAPVPEGGASSLALASGGSTASLPSGSPAASGEKFATGLATYIKDKGGDASQVDRFLIVADWLRLRGEAKLTTALISKTLVDNHQKRLANPSDCLSKNLSKGFCEKTDNGFYITPEGLKRLGHG